MFLSLSVPCNPHPGAVHPRLVTDIRFIATMNPPEEAIQKRNAYNPADTIFLRQKASAMPPGGQDKAQITPPSHQHKHRQLQTEIPAFQNRNHFQRSVKPDTFETNIDTALYMETTVRQAVKKTTVRRNPLPH
ncbi:MAG: hypothetical protein LBJ39_02915 [Tannerellaceae bacterium]|nr:hypothetical protein [Tannerellaceae bacterium]